MCHRAAVVWLECGVDAQHGRQMGHQLEIRRAWAEGGRRGRERQCRCTISAERFDECVEACANFARSAGPRVLERVGGPAQQVGDFDRAGHGAAQHADVRGKRARDTRQHLAAIRAIRGGTHRIGDARRDRNRVGSRHAASISASTSSRERDV